MTLAHQAHSQTSLMAALEAARTADTQIQKILAYIETCGMLGATGKQIAAKFKMQTGTVSARLRDMQLRGLIKKSATMRDKSYVWYPERYIRDEVDSKRDKAKEALRLVETMKKEPHGPATMDCLNRLYQVLK